MVHVQLVIVPPYIGIPLDEKNRERNQQVSAPYENPANRFNGIFLGQDDQDHDQVPGILEPPLERNKRVVGPKHAKQEIEVKDP